MDDSYKRIVDYRDSNFVLRRNMPSLQSEFEAMKKSDRVKDLEEALVFAFKDLSKIAKREVKDPSRHAQECMNGLYAILKL